MSDEANLIKVDKLKELIEINNKINSSYFDQNTLLTSILESSMALVECESSSILLVNKKDNTLRFVIALGPKGTEAKNIPVAKNSIAGWVVNNNQSIVINDVCSDSRFNDSVQQKTQYVTRNMIAIPMNVNGECVGVIELINKKDDRDFDESDLDLLELIGTQAGIAYQNSNIFRSTKDMIQVLNESAKRGDEYHTFIAKSANIVDLMNVIDQVAKTNSNVLIIGESGVGKELFAEQLHIKSLRNGKPFIRVSCAALSPTLLESELFGHVKGAFTDAIKDQKGRFEAADGGTLFLDEIGELPLNLQSKLLRVIQERKFERVGSSETITVDVRIIAATNRDLEEMVDKNEFRGDLYYRLNVLPINVPPLRQRKDDIEPLAEFFMEKFSAETKKNFEGFSQSAISALYNYLWPGNIRELENTIERACILGHPPYIQINDLRLPVSVDDSSESSSVNNAVSELVTNEDRTLKSALNAFKKQYITKILEETNWNQTKTAKILDVQRTYVSKLMTELDIRRM